MTTVGRCTHSGGEITWCVELSRRGAFSFSTICPAALKCARSVASAGRAMYSPKGVGNWIVVHAVAAAQAHGAARQDAAYMEGRPARQA